MRLRDGVVEPAPQGLHDKAAGTLVVRNATPSDRS